ncbi:UNVERIFIED_CONTAM: hypothetical protein Scaly_0987500 [Sesamum calycinum]|uniref:Uncharacterized protein n=1 Tax=Sesamum calycinum TaxID=2727403 RepID=A0AAW2QZ60_9LAMI
MDKVKYPFKIFSNMVNGSFMLNFMTGKSTEFAENMFEKKRMLIWENKLPATETTRMKTCNMLHVGQWHNHEPSSCEPSAAIVWLEEVRKTEDLEYRNQGGQTKLDVDYVLFQNPPETPVQASTLAITPAETSTVGTAAKSKDEAKQKHNRDNKTVRGHFLNHMNNSLFDLFVNYRTAKDIWTTLEIRYKGDDTGRKKYVVGRWLQFQMIDEKSSGRRHERRDENV